MKARSNSSQNPILPVPGQDALAHTVRVVEYLREQIVQAGGWLPFSRYMELVLYAPGLGYYAAGARKFGQLESDGSDFVTAPEMTPLFGQTLASQLAEWLPNTAPQIMEFGAGTGKLAAHLLNELARLETPCEQYWIIELSGDLRERQRATLQQLVPEHAHKVQWLDSLPSTFKGIMLGNEVLDAMPIGLWHWQNAQWSQRGVVWQAAESSTTPADGWFAFADRPADATNHPREALPDWTPTNDPYLYETHAAEQGFMRSLGQALEQGYIVMIDYGFPAHEYYHPQRNEGTLMCHYRHHAHDDPFYLPGLQDITAHVNFSAIAAAGQEAALELLGYTSQARFLINCGLTDRLAQLDPSQMANYLPQANALQKLVSEAEMGELFKVIAFAKSADHGASGFMRGDRSHTL